MTREQYDARAAENFDHALEADYRAERAAGNGDEHRAGHWRRVADHARRLAQHWWTLASLLPA